MLNTFLSACRISLPLLLLFCIYTKTVFPQEVISQEKIDELVNIYSTSGETGIKEYAKKHKEILNNKIIVKLAKRGYNQSKEELLNIAIILANEFKDKKTIADVNIQYAKDRIFFGDDPTEYLENALSIYIELNDTVGQGDVYFSRGWSYDNNNCDYQRSSEMYSKALKFYEKANNLEGQGNVYDFQGRAYFDFGDNQKALEMFSKALPFFEKLNAIKGLANIYISQGDVYLYSGNFQRALENFAKTLPLAEKTNDEYALGHVYRSQGYVYLWTGDNQKALEMFSKALYHFEKSKNSFGLGSIYRCLGDLYFQIGDNQRALEMYSKGLPYLEKVNDEIGQTSLYNSQGELYFSNGDNQRALEMYSKALTFSIKANEPIGQGNAHWNLGDIYFSTGDINKALEMYSKASTFYEKANALESEAFILLSKAELFEKTKQLTDAYDNYVVGLSKLEKVRTQIGFSEMKMGFQEKIGEQYSKAINFMLANNYNEKAFEYYENTKARTLLDQITEKKMYDVEKGIDSTLKMRRDEISNQLSFCQSQLTQTTDSATTKELKAQYKSLDDEFEKVKQEIRFKNPLYAAINYPKAVPISKLKNEILKPEEVLLQYYFSEESVFVFVITNDNFEIVKLPASRNEIEQEAANFNERVLSSKKDPYVVSALYQQLIEPFKEIIEDKETLLIVPDGMLSFIPFEAIYVEGGEDIRYLLEDYNIKYIQSGTMLSLLREELEKENTSNSFIGFGDPVYDYENYMAQQPEKGQIVKEEQFALLNRDGYERAGGKLDRLEGSGQEVDEISKMFGTKPYLRIEASEEKVKSADMKNYGYMLFSCHGLISDEFQSLVLSQIPGSKEDGYLTLGEISNLDWNAQLVVLSACQTGKGKVKKGEGVVGMTRAIMLAGTPAAVVSLWNVSDQGTKELMIRFFRKIIEEEMTKEEALRKAKLEMLKTDYKNPYYWSAFVMYGE